jgi:putative ABC transport system permease protein
VQAITGSQLATENLDDINSGFLGFLSTGLTAFAAVALLVAAFSIYNTFSILAAQRGRESALLRALGGTRRQLAVAGLAETLVVGVVGSVAGWAASASPCCSRGSSTASASRCPRAAWCCGRPVRCSR